MFKRKKVNDKYTLKYTPHFPFVTSAKGGSKALLGIGGNIGNVVRRFEHLFWVFRRSVFVRILETSPIVKNPAFGYTKQEDFDNALILLETKLTPKKLLRYLLRVERVFGRKRSFQDAPRTLDIDIIFYQNVTMESSILTLPHHGWKQRASVLIPLSHMKGCL